MKATLCLECEGFQYNGFYMCRAAKNIILDLEDIESLDNYFEIVQYLDHVVGIFNEPCNKYNIITNAIYKLYQMDVIGEELYKSISYFYKIHAKCSLVLSCEPKK